MKMLNTIEFHQDMAASFELIKGTTELDFWKYDKQNSRGVYQIINLATGDYYIGAAFENFGRRWRQHQYAWANSTNLVAAKLSNQNLINAFVSQQRDYKAFLFKVLSYMPTATKEQIAAKEKHLIEICKPKYNIDK